MTNSMSMNMSSDQALASPYLPFSGKASTARVVVHTIGANIIKTTSVICVNENNRYAIIRQLNGISQGQSTTMADFVD